MQETTQKDVLKLLAAAKERGIDIFLVNKELAVSFPKKSGTDAVFLSELKANKHLLAEYLNQQEEKGAGDWRKWAIPERKMEYRGKIYYEVSPYQSYWIDDKNKEFKDKLRCWLGYRTSGNFDPGLFRNAVAYVIGRHESLRSTFRTIGGKHYITTEEDLSQYEPLFRDQQRVKADSIGETENWFFFAGHAFDLEKGPLIQIRIARTGEREYLVAIIMHHSIFDGWSLEILMRELLISYWAFEKGEQPGLPPLKFQYKEWLNFRRHLIESNYVQRQQYWLGLYNGLPDRLLLPGAKVSKGEPVSCRDGKKEYMTMPDEIRGRLQGLCGQHRTSLFVILQASFMLYLSRLTGRRDILTGTMLFGRDSIENLEDQIGFYSYTDLIRVVFDEGDSLDLAIGKVKKSNEDMHRYTDFTLLMALTRYYTDRGGSAFPFWSVNLDFTESAGYTVSPLANRSSSPDEVQFHPIDDKYAGTETDMDLKVKFVNHPEKLEIRVHYDGDLYESSAIKSLMNGYLHFLEEKDIYARLPAQPKDR